MEHTRRLTAWIGKEDDILVSLCPELDIASQGARIDAARSNPREALTLFFQTADLSEIASQLHPDNFVTSVEVPIG